MKTKLVIGFTIFALMAILLFPGPKKTLVLMPALAERGTIHIESPSGVTEPLPMIVVLHGYRANAWIQSNYLNLSRFVESRRFHLVYLEGSKDPDGDRFWNANASCCDLHHTGVDDAKYIADVIYQLKKSVEVSKVLLWGHSNGAFMAYRMLCDYPTLINGVLAIAGLDANPTCADPFVAHSLIHVHGSKDRIIATEGGSFKGLAPYPVLEQSMNRWASRLHCAPAPVLSRHNYSLALWGQDSDQANYQCDFENRLVSVRIQGGGHQPFFSDEFRGEMIDLLTGK